MKNGLLAEFLNFKMAFDPADLDTAQNGARIKLAKGDRLTIIAQMGDSTAAVATFALKQHDAATSGVTKELSVANKYYTKAGTATKFTQVEPTVAADTYNLSTTFAAEPGIAVFEVNSDDLDVNNGFAWASVNVADSTAAKIGSVLYVLSNNKSLPAYSEDI